MSDEMSNERRAGSPDERVLEPDGWNRYTLTEDELSRLKKAAATPGVFIGGLLAGHDPARSASETIWKELGRLYGFQWRTVRPVPGRPHEVFEARRMKQQEEKAYEVPEDLLQRWVAEWPTVLTEEDQSHLREFGKHVVEDYEKGRTR